MAALQAVTSETRWRNDCLEDWIARALASCCGVNLAVATGVAVPVFPQAGAAWQGLRLAGTTLAGNYAGGDYAGRGYAGSWLYAGRELGWQGLRWQRLRWPGIRWQLLRWPG
jgi:hypothetical protein